MKLGTLTLSALLFAFHLSSAYAVSVKVCEQEASTPLETAYCQVIAKGEGAGLPDFYSFSRNPPQTQYLLLLGPAKKAGVTLAKPARHSSSRTTNAAPPKTKKPAQRASQLSSDQQAPTDLQTAPISNQNTTNKATTNEAAISDQCTLNDSKIFCGATSYFLVINTPVKRVNKKDLGPQNRLKFRQRLNNETSVQYVSNLYPHYIEKMLAIGLGDSTLSFTKFHAIYESSLSSEENFSERFHDMYELLKRERQTMGIKQRYINNFPETVAQCMQVTDNIITCDNVVQNWVYKKLRK